MPISVGNPSLSFIPVSSQTPSEQDPECEGIEIRERYRKPGGTGQETG